LQNRKEYQANQLTIISYVKVCWKRYWHQ